MNIYRQTISGSIALPEFRCSETVVIEHEDGRLVPIVSAEQN